MPIPFKSKGGGKKLLKKAQSLQPQSVKSAEKKLAVEVVKTKSKVRNLQKKIGTDIRYQDNNIPAQAVSTSGVFFLFNGMATGDQNGNRDGTTITTQQIEVRGTVTVADTVNVVRIILLYDKQSDTAAPSISTLLSTTGDPRANYNWIHRNRYKILADRMICLSAQGPAMAKFHIRYYKKLRTYYELTNNADITDISKGSIYLFAISDSGTVSHPTLDANWRIVYQP